MFYRQAGVDTELLATTSASMYITHNRTKDFPWDFLIF